MWSELLILSAEGAQSAPRISLAATTERWADGGKVGAACVVPARLARTKYWRVSALGKAFGAVASEAVSSLSGGRVQVSAQACRHLHIRTLHPEKFTMTRRAQVRLF